NNQNQNQNPNQNQNQKPANSGSSLDVPNAAPPVSAEEEAAVKAVQAMPTTDVQKKIAAGEELLKKYPESRYRPIVYSALTFEYIQTGKPEKALEVGDNVVVV